MGHCFRYFGGPGIQIDFVMGSLTSEVVVPIALGCLEEVPVSREAAVAGNAGGQLHLSTAR